MYCTVMPGRCGTYDTIMPNTARVDQCAGRDVAKWGLGDTAHLGAVGAQRATSPNLQWPAMAASSGPRPYLATYSIYLCPDLALDSAADICYVRSPCASRLRQVRSGLAEAMRPSVVGESCR